MADEYNISEKEVLQVVQNHNGNGAEIINCQIKPASDEILGFIGEHIRILVSASLEGRKTNLQYFGKQVPTKVKAHKEYAESTRAFYKEIELYKTLFRDMENADKRQVKWRPDCYYTRDWDLVIVEDLSLQGYKMLPERTLMDLKTMQETVKAMARMHASSFIFEEKLNAGLCSTLSTNFSPDKGKVTIGDLYPNLIFESECTDAPGHPGYTFWEVGIKAQVAVIDLLPGYSTEQKEKIKEVFPDAIRQIYRMLEPSDKFRNVMIHADLWGNNVLIRERDGVSDVILVDYQMTRYAPPAQDLLMLLHITQNKTFRDQYEAEITDLYYLSLTQELAAEGLDINHLLPRQEFGESCVFYKRYAILNQMIYTQLPIWPPEVCEKFMSTPEAYDRVMFKDRADIMVECFHTDQSSRERIIEAMDEIIRIERLA